MVPSLSVTSVFMPALFSMDERLAVQFKWHCATVDLPGIANICSCLISCGSERGRAKANILRLRVSCRKYITSLGKVFAKEVDCLRAEVTLNDIAVEYTVSGCCILYTVKI